MNIFEELKPRIETFKATREHVLSSALLPPTDAGMRIGKPPFAVDDGTSYYAVIDKNGDVSQLPFGYQIPNEEMETEGADAIFSAPMAAAGGGMNIARYIPLVENYDIPGDRAFCLETAEDSVAWEAVGKMADQIQQVVNEGALFNFHQRLANTISCLYESCEEIESVDQAIAVLFLDSSLLTVLFLRSYQHALDALEDEMSAAEEDDDE